MQAGTIGAANEGFSVQEFINAMHAGGDVRHVAYISYGFMSAVFSFMQAKEVLQF